MYVHQKSDVFLINVFCAVIVVKNVLQLAQRVFSYFVVSRKQGTFSACDQSFTFAQPAVQTAR